MSVNLENIKNLLIRKFFTYRKSLNISIAIFVGVTAFFCVIKTLSGAANVINYTMFALPCVIFAGIFPFMEYSNNKSASFQILIPANHTEKYIVDFIVAYIVFPVSVFAANIIGFYIGQIIIKLIFLFKGLQFSIPAIKEIFTVTGWADLGTWLIVILGVSISFFGAVFYKRYRVLKIWLVAVAIIFLLFFSIGVAQYVYYKANGHFFTFDIVYEGGKILYNINGRITENKPWILSSGFWYSVWTVISLSLMCFTYRKLKREKA